MIPKAAVRRTSVLMALLVCKLVCAISHTAADEAAASDGASTTWKHFKCPVANCLKCDRHKSPTSHQWQYTCKVCARKYIKQRDGTCVAPGTCTSASNKLMQLTAPAKLQQGAPSTFCFKLDTSVLPTTTPCHSQLASSAFNITFNTGGQCKSATSSTLQDRMRWFIKLASSGKIVYMKHMTSGRELTVNVASTRYGSLDNGHLCITLPTADNSCQNLYELAERKSMITYNIRTSGGLGSCCLSSSVNLNLPPVIPGAFTVADLPSNKGGSTTIDLVNSNKHIGPYVYDLTGMPLAKLTVVSQPKYGSAIVIPSKVGPGVIKYTYGAGGALAYTFTYRLTTAQGNTRTGTIKVTRKAPAGAKPAAGSVGPGSFIQMTGAYPQGLACSGDSSLDNCVYASLQGDNAFLTSGILPTTFRTCRYQCDNDCMINNGNYPLLYSAAFMYSNGAYIGSPAFQFASGSAQQGTDVVQWQAQNVTDSGSLGFGISVGPVNGYVCDHAVLDPADPIVDITIYSWPAFYVDYTVYPNICEMTYTTKSGATFRSGSSTQTSNACEYSGPLNMGYDSTTITLPSGGVVLVSLNTTLVGCMGNGGECPGWTPAQSGQQVTQLQFVYTQPVTSQVQIQSIVPAGDISQDPAPMATTAAGIFIINSLNGSYGANLTVSCAASVSQIYASTMTNSVSKEVTKAYSESLSVEGGFSFASGSYDPGSGSWSQSSMQGTSLSTSNSFTLTDTVSCAASNLQNCFAVNTIYNGTYSFPVSIQATATIGGSTQGINMAGTFTGTGGQFTYANVGFFSLSPPAPDAFQCSPSTPAINGNTLDPNVYLYTYIDNTAGPNKLGAASANMCGPFFENGHGAISSIMVTWFNASIVYDDYPANYAYALGLTGFIIGMEITTTTGYSCMIGSNDTNSVEWTKKTEYDGTFVNFIQMTPLTTNISFNVTKNEYITDFHVYLARDISKEPWIDATEEHDDYDWKKCLRAWGGGVIGLRLCTNMAGPATAYDEWTSAKELGQCYSVGITSTLFADTWTNDGQFNGVPGSFWSPVPGYQVIDVGSGILDGFFYTMQETNIGPECPGDDNFPGIFKGSSLWGIGPIFLQPYNSVQFDATSIGQPDNYNENTGILPLGQIGSWTLNGANPIPYSFGMYYNSNSSYTLNTGESFSNVEVRGASWNVKVPLPKAVPVKGKAGIGGSWMSSTTEKTTLANSTTVTTGQAVSFACTASGSLGSKGVRINGFGFPSAQLPVCATVTMSFASGYTYSFVMQTSVTSTYSAYGMLNITLDDA